MTAQPDLADLEARRERLARLAEQLSDEIDRMPTPELYRRLDDIVISINALDRLIAARRGRDGTK